MDTENKELFSEKIRVGIRTYFFDVKEATDGTKYLVITEAKQPPPDQQWFERQRVMVFQENLPAFKRGFRNAVRFMKELVRAEKKNKPEDLEQIRRRYLKAYAKWEMEDDALLKTKHRAGKTINELAEIFQRKPGAIRSRLNKLGLIEK